MCLFALGVVIGIGCGFIGGIILQSWQDHNRDCDNDFDR